MGSVHRKTTLILAAMENYAIFPSGTYSCEELRAVLRREGIIAAAEGDLHFATTYVPRAKNWSCGGRPLSYTHAALPVPRAGTPVQTTLNFDPPSQLDRIEAKLDQLLSR